MMLKKCSSALQCAVVFLATAGRGEEAGLVVHYDFDEGSGTTTRDRSGRGNDGAIHGARYVKLGKG